MIVAISSGIGIATFPSQRNLLSSFLISSKVSISMTSVSLSMHSCVTFGRSFFETKSTLDSEWFRMFVTSLADDSGRIGMAMRRNGREKCDSPFRHVLRQDCHLVRCPDSELRQPLRQHLTCPPELLVCIFMFSINDFRHPILRIPARRILIKFTESVDVRFPERIAVPSKIHDFQIWLQM